MQRFAVGSLRSSLEAIYRVYNKTDFIHPDPLELVLRYDEPCNQELAGLIASCFALGRVSAIVSTVTAVLKQLTPLERSIRTKSRRDLERLFEGFVYRFYDGANLVSLLLGIRSCLERFGTLEQCYLSGSVRSGGDPHEALCRFVAELRSGDGSHAGMLAVPERGSGCKRLHLYLRWMVRRDAVDPGPWRCVDPSVLSVPVDVHMLRICRLLGLTDRKDTSRRTTREITAAFREIVPEDPVRFDFALTRSGIHPELSYDELGRFFPGVRHIGS